jgi:CheY-like chemotaxis protein
MLRPLAVRADQKGLELICNIAPDVPAGIVGDPVRLQQVLANLVANAIKFTEAGHVLIDVRQEVGREGATLLHFSVSDTGIGIPVEKHATIFEAFSQADGSTTRRFGGTGLGLTISATLVNLMGGRIWVESEPGQGSSFHFTAAFDLGEAPEAVSHEPLLANLPVLIVDDNPINRRILEQQVSRWQMSPTAVEGGRAALDALNNASRADRPFALVLLDANMPEMDGFDVAAAILNRPELGNATIMMLTSSGHYGDAGRCRDLGISAYLTKPVKQADLLEAICRALETRAPVLKTAPRTSAAPVHSHGSQLSTVLLAEDNVVNQRVAVGLLSRRGHHVIVASNGREAVAAFERDRFDLILMDVQMPVMGGFDATAAIRERERDRGTGERVRIVAMTAHAMAGDRDRCLQAGMDGYLSKPVEPDALFAVVERNSAGVTSAPAPIDRSSLLERLGGDEAFMGEVAAVFLDDCPRRVAEIKAAVDRRDSEAIRLSAHALKGAAGVISATGLLEAARVLERLGAEGRLDAAEAAWRALSTEATSAMATMRYIAQTS